MLVIYTLSNCDSCKKAVRWMRDHNLGFVEKAIRETPPSPAELQAMLARQRGDVRRLFNTAGRDYRAAGLKDTLPKMAVDDALALLAANGNLVKRPFLLGPACGLVGFDATAWTEALLASG